MFSNALVVSSLFVASAMAVATPQPYKLGMMSENPAFGLAKRQAGYEPTQTYCDYGETCAEACGANYIQCPSSDNSMHCYDPSINEKCCPDGEGNSCSDGYYCTSDSTGGTWCCPDGMDLVQCAAAYSLTGVLVSQTPTATLAASSTLPASVSVSTTTTPATTVTPASETTTKAPGTTTTPAAKTTSAGANTTKTTTSAPIQVTGAAGHIVAGGLNAIALGAAALLVL